MEEYRRLKQTMEEVKAIVDAELRRFFNAKRKEAERVHPALVELVDQVADVTLRGGKRIRPFLCRVGYAAVISDQRQVINKIPKELLSAMMGLELFQTFAIVHDDIMDADKERRGGPTIHEQSGVNIGILAGDLALAWADELIGDKRYTMKDARPQKRDPYMIYQKMKEEVIYGQTMDVMRNIGVKDIEKGRVDELKTAYYSVVRPLQIGSSLALKDSLSERLSLLNTWERYGRAVGRLFQLRDDVLDGVVTEEACTKEAKDLRNQAHEALEPLETSDEIRQLLVDFIRFVQNRKS